MIHVEAVTVCVGYCDFLAAVEPFNRAQLDRWLIITAPKDEETREFCRNRSLECLVTDDFYRAGLKTFDKAMGVERGLQMLTHRDWIMHIDADIVLPGHFRESLIDAHLDPNCLHGVDRFNVRGWAQWQRLIASGFFNRFSRSAHHNVCLPEGFPLGARWADVVQGYIPIGFLQLWHHSADTWRGIRTRRYPTAGHADAARTDVQFALQWDRRYRRLLPEVVVAHLESEGAATGANWSGRTTPRFGPSSKPAPSTPGPS